MTSIEPPSDTFLSPDDAARESMYHPVVLILLGNSGVSVTGVATIEFRKGAPQTVLPFKLLPADDRFVMGLIGRDRSEFVSALDDFALWTPNYADFFDLDTAHPVLLLDAFEQ